MKKGKLALILIVLLIFSSLTTYVILEILDYKSDISENKIIK